MDDATQKITRVTGRAIPLPGNDIDTDRIIPARFLRCVTFEGLGQYAFVDERFKDGVRVADHPLNDSRFAGGEILIVQRNFGCGSSREHAPQALKRMGIKAIVGQSFAEIFAGNCTSIGLPVVTAGEETIAALMRAVEARPEQVILIDLEKMQLESESVTSAVAMPDAWRQALVSGEWDMAGVLLRNLEAIRGIAAQIPYLTGFRGVTL